MSYGTLANVKESYKWNSKADILDIVFENSDKFLLDNFLNPMPYVW